MEAFKSTGVVPDVIDEVPAGCLQLCWGEKQLSPGDILTPTQVKDVPKVAFDGAQEGKFYTLIHNDPDAPSRADPKFGQFQHWLVVNIPKGDILNGEEMTQYIGSGAPKGTGLHRYVYLLYEQPDGKMDFSAIEKVPNTSASGRRLQNAREFAAKHKLKLVAGNFYQAEYDDYVPTLHAQMGLGKK